MPEMGKKAAFVAVVGRPSVGKSTLVNQICGAKVAIVSPVPQTTRNAIRGIVSKPEGQLVFVDTPGRHDSGRKLNRKLMEVSDRSMDESDLVLYMLDAARAPGIEEAETAEKLLPCQNRLIAAVNKMDAPGADYERASSFLLEKFSSPVPRYKISALNREGIEALLEGLFSMAPRGEAFYPEGYYTDQEVSFRIAEIIREQAVNRLRQELPHSLYVEVADMEFRQGETRLWVRAFIITERESQKGMVVGKGGEMIKAIGQAARKELNRIFDWKIELDLRVKTAKDWRHNDGLLKRLIR